MMKKYFAPYASLSFRDMWDIFFLLLVPSPASFILDLKIYESVANYYQFGQKYSTSLLSNLNTLDLLIIGNKCTKIPELSYLPLEFNVTFPHHQH